MPPQQLRRARGGPLDGLLGPGAHGQGALHLHRLQGSRARAAVTGGDEQAGIAGALQHRQRVGGKGLVEAGQKAGQGGAFGVQEVQGKDLPGKKIL